MRGSLCPGLLQRGVWEAVSGMREAKPVEILQVPEVKGWVTGRGAKTTLEIPNAYENDGTGGCMQAARLHLQDEREDPVFLCCLAFCP